MKWWEKLIGRKPVQTVETPLVEPTAEEVVQGLVEYSDGLFQQAHEARAKAAEVMREAARESETQAANVLSFAEQAYQSAKERAEALAALARERALAAEKNNKIAERLSEFF